MSLSVQWLTMAMMLLSGIGMGVVFDGYRVVSDELKINRWWIPVFDLLYWIAATVIVFQVLSASNEGEVRTYVFLGLLLGIGCYYWLFSRIVVRLVHGLIRATRAIIQFAVRAFVLLVIRPLGLLYKLAKLILAFLLAFTIFLFRIVLQLLRPLWVLVRWMTRPIARPAARWIAGLVVPLAARWRLRERSESVTRFMMKCWKLVFKRSKDG
ncbi:spore cortex biosynthesis protein YabQ [Paenibacillus spongiae]|uniref:Spore cortex biosynthesis protein YabQ n=1 Tax=Paenibacillus spongiae TaxID=2909671 RepID=A0ABY5S8Y3_9BACL|nr:spore cortex biosynthesis protein YabQ [Paenibacillus spongiae]UVI30369.1 spore cortex biosynthesis protein YabQ [Paenibacillus spongiae]